jgi:hypothetical protein
MLHAASKKVNEIDSWEVFLPQLSANGHLHEQASCTCIKVAISPYPLLKLFLHLYCGISQGSWFYVPSSISTFTECVDRVHGLLLAASGSRNCCVYLDPLSRHA